MPEEAKPRGKVRDDGGRLMDPGQERSGGARLVVILQEAGHFVLVVLSRPEMLAHRLRVPVAEPIVQSLVVCIIESLLLQRPFEIPIHFGHETELGSLLPRT